MTPADPTTKVYPGVDEKSHVHQFRRKTSEMLNNIYGIKVKPEEMVPDREQSPVTEELGNVMAKPQSEVDFGDILEGHKGNPRTEKSKNFLKLLLGRLRKKHPESEVKLENK